MAGLNFPGLFLGGTRIRGTSGNLIDIQSGTLPWKNIAFNANAVVTLDATQTAQSGAFLNVFEFGEDNFFTITQSGTSASFESDITLDFGTLIKFRSTHISFSQTGNTGMSAFGITLEHSEDDVTYTSLGASTIGTDSEVYYELGGTNFKARYLRIRMNNVRSSGSTPAVFKLFTVVANL